MNYRPFVKYLLLGILSLGIAPNLFAQLSLGGLPSETISTKQLRSISTESEEFVVVLPPPPQAEIERLLEEEAQGMSLVRSMHRMGIPQDVDLSPENSGAISYDKEGRLIWELVLKSPQAISLQVFFDRYHLPEGSRLFVLSPERNIVRGAFGAHNNTVDSCLAIAPLEGESLLIRYESPINDQALPLLHIGSVSYGFRALIHESAGRHNSGEPWFVGGMDCAPNVVLHPEVEDISRSLVLIVARGSVVFSGALINNTAQNGEAYVLTASHCLNGSFKYPNNASYRDNTASQCVFYFNFRSPTGHILTRPSEEQTLSGAKIVAWDEDHDLCLLRITGVPRDEVSGVGRIPASYRPYFAGWNVADHQPPYIALHHPQASTARYNRCDDMVSIVDYSVTAKTWKNAHYHINKWTIGTTAGGSSGSPLFDAHGRIIGALTGGNSYCYAPKNDFYYAIKHCWDTNNQPTQGKLKPWLDPTASQVQNLKGLDPYAPLAPERLSHNLYSLRRDSIETSYTYITQLSGVRTSYPITVDSRILGIKIVATTGGKFPSGVVTLYRGDSQGAIEEVYSTRLIHPKYTRIDGRYNRTLGGNLEFFIPIPEGVILPKNSTLYIAVTGDKDNALTPLQLPIVRSVQLPRSANTTEIRPLGVTEWTPSNASTLVETLRYTGSFWIDAIVQPMHAPVPDEGQKPTDSPSVLLLDRTMRVVFPPNYEGEKAEIALYTISGKCILRATTHQRITDLEIPLSAMQQSLLWSVNYKDQIFRDLAIL